jgi:hypothetical protein
MLHNLLLTALRNLKRNKFFSLLNILGLATGFQAIKAAIANPVKSLRTE